MSVLGTGLRWVDLKPYGLQNHITSGDPINDNGSEFYGLNSHTDNVGKEESMCIQGLGSGDHVLDQVAAERDPNVVANMDPEFDHHAVKIQQESQALYVNGSLHGPGALDKIIRAHGPHGGNMQAIAQLFGSVGQDIFRREAKLGQEERDLNAGALYNDTNNPFNMPPPSLQQAAGSSTGHNNPHLTRYFQEAADPFSIDGQRKVDAKESLGLRSKYIQQNSGQLLRERITEAEQADKALERVTSTFMAKNAHKEKGRGQDLSVLAPRGFVDEETLERNREILQFDGHDATAIGYGLNDLSTQSYARLHKQKKKKGSLINNIYMG